MKLQIINIYTYKYIVSFGSSYACAVSLRVYATRIYTLQIGILYAIVPFFREDGGISFPRNVSTLLSDYGRHMPQDIDVEFRSDCKALHEGVCGSGCTGPHFLSEVASTHWIVVWVGLSIGLDAEVKTKPIPLPNPDHRLFRNLECCQPQRPSV